MYIHIHIYVYIYIHVFITHIYIYTYIFIHIPIRDSTIVRDSESQCYYTHQLDSSFRSYSRYHSAHARGSRSPLWSWQRFVFPVDSYVNLPSVVMPSFYPAPPFAPKFPNLDLDAIIHDFTSSYYTPCIWFFKHHIYL